MATGTAVVVAGIGDGGIILTHMDDGYLVDPGSERSYAEGIIHLLSDDNLRDRLKKNAKKKASLYDWENIMPKWLALYDSVLDINGNR